MKYKSEGFIYPYTTDEEKEMIHNTEKQLAYDEGVDAGIKEGIEQNKIEMVKNFYKIGTPIEDIAKASNLSVEKVREIVDLK